MQIGKPEVVYKLIDGGKIMEEYTFTPKPQATVKSVNVGTNENLSFSKVTSSSTYNDVETVISAVNVILDIGGKEMSVSKAKRVITEVAAE